MKCFLCNQPIDSQAEIDWHHYETLKSEGGTLVAATHQTCHVEYHSKRGDFKRWGSRGGKQAAASMRWAFNLRHVSTDPAYRSHRQFYLQHYAYAGWSEF
jgi:hypothetical protein